MLNLPYEEHCENNGATTRFERRTTTAKEEVHGSNDLTTSPEMCRNNYESILESPQES